MALRLYAKCMAWFQGLAIALVQASLAAAIVAAQPGSSTLPDNQPAEPFRIADNVYYVGASDIASYLITTPAGHILIDGGDTSTVPLIERSMTKLGFKLQDVKILVNTQAHFDHAGGFARLKELTGAQLWVSEGDAALIERGGRGDFLFDDKLTFPAAPVDRRLKDDDEVRLGGVTLKAHLTPGHTKGCTTWTLDAPDRGATRHIVIIGGTSINPGTRVSGMPTYPGITSDYEHTFEVLKRLPCDIPLGAHASYVGLMDKAKALRRNPRGANPFVDPSGYREYIEHGERRFREQLAKEKSP